MRRRFDPYLVLAFLFSLIMLGPLLYPGYFWNAHDARHSVFFLFELDRSIRDGVLYPRWSPDFAFGYGYPFFNIYGPLSSYVGEVFHLLGFDFVTSVKIVFGLSIVLSGLAMFLFVRRLMGSRAALVAAMVYVYAPYHIFDIYVRAALAESVSFVFIPLVLWGGYETVMHPRWNAIVGMAFAYAGLMFTSNLVTLLITPILALYITVLVLVKLLDEMPLRGFSREYVLMLMGEFLHLAIPPATGLLLGLLLSAVFWLPAATEFKYVRTDQWMGGYYDYQDHFVYFFQLFSPRWGFDISRPGPDDDLGFQLGIVPYALGVLSLLAFSRLKGHLKAQAVFFLALTVAVIFLALPTSLPLWEALRLVRFAQFPWRLLFIPVLSLSFLAPLILEATGRDTPPLSAVLLAVLVVLGSYPYVRAEPGEPPEGGVSLAGLMRFQRTSNEMTGSTAWVREIPTWSPFADLHIAGIEVVTRIDYGSIPDDTSAVTLEWHTASELIGYKTDRDDLTITFNLFYYPGWTAYLLEKEDDTYRVVGKLPLKPEDGPLGRVTVKVPRGLHYVLLRFEDTPIRKAGTALTWLGLMLVVVVYGLRRAFFAVR
ncbi:MAG TPA: hypothetical protein ENG33_10415 [Chloroflexi bacterium]|nr:hypothetical protein [Chloroflexota bacterium]